MKKLIQKLYFKLYNKLHNNFEPLVDGYDYSVLGKYSNYNLSLYNPLEVLYFAIMEVYDGKVDILGIHGFDINYEHEDLIEIIIYCSRPGLLIGYRGRDIDKLKEVLTKYYRGPIKISIKEKKKK